MDQALHWIWIGFLIAIGMALAWIALVFLVYALGFVLSVLSILIHPVETMIQVRNELRGEFGSLNWKGDIGKITRKEWLLVALMTSLLIAGVFVREWLFGK